MRILSLFILFTLSISLHAQDDKKSIAVVGTNSNCSQSIAPEIVAEMEEILSKDDRFIPASRDVIKLVEKQLDDQKDAIYLSAENIVESVKTTGAEFIIHIDITGCSTSERRDSDNRFTGYSGEVSAKFTAIDVKTASSMIVENYKGSGTSSGNNRQKAILNAGENINRKCKKFLNDAFPLEVKILKMTKASKGKAEEILIRGGSDLGIVKNDLFEVKKVETIDGELTMETLIGKLKVIALNGAEICTVKPRNGKEAKAIHDAINSGAKLKVMRINRTGLNLGEVINKF